jgi:Xaa-Pro aminopeptidase
MRLKAWTLAILVGLISIPLFGFEKEPLSEYAARRARVAEQIKGSALILFGQAENEFVKFKQTDNFLYLTGFIEPDAVLVIDATGDKPEDTLFIRSRNPDKERWDGAMLPAGAEGQRETGIASVKVLTELNSSLIARAQRNIKVFTEANDARSMERLRALAPSVQPQDIAPTVAGLRIRKAATEIALLEKTINITLAGHKAAAKAIRPGAWEYEVEAVLEYEFRRNGAERPSFPSIVGSGPNSTTLHYNASTRQMKAGDLVVIDVGAEYSGYAGDVTRTYPVSGRFTPRQREIYQIVLEAQKRALEKVKPGATLRQVHRAAYDYIESKGFEKEFPHGTSHHLGLYVHDVGDASRPLEAGMVITVEPGIYIDKEALGVRIEDDVVVTENGYRMLSNFPKEIGDIEAMMR